MPSVNTGSAGDFGNGTAGSGEVTFSMDNPDVREVFDKDRAALKVRHCRAVTPQKPRSATLLRFNSPTSTVPVCDVCAIVRAQRSDPGVVAFVVAFTADDL